MNIAVTKIVRYHYSRDRITIVWSLWRHQQSIVTSSTERKPSEWDTGTMSFMDSLCRVRNKIMYVLSWRTVSVHTRVLFWYFFPSLLLNSGNKHQNNPVVSAETVRHSSTYIILYIMSYIGPSAVVSEAFGILIPYICHTITDRMRWFVACLLRVS